MCPIFGRGGPLSAGEIEVKLPRRGGKEAEVTALDE